MTLSQDDQSTIASLQREVERLCSEVRVLTVLANGLEEERDQTRAAVSGLREYAWHTYECDLLIVTPPHKRMKFHTCSCGLDKALTDTGGEE